MKPTISVVIPFYKEGKLLENSIGSVLTQTFQDFEIILVDNNASDETRQVAARFASLYPDRIRILHEADQGVCSARNTGIRNAMGPFIALLDGDDMMKEERLARQLEAIQSQSNVSVISCYHDFITHDGEKIIKKNVPELSYNSQNIFELKEILKQILAPLNLPYMDSFDLLSAPFLFFKKEDAIKAGLFDIRLNPRDKEDWEFIIRMFLLGKFYLVPESLQYYRDENPQTRKFKLKDKHLKRVLLHEQKFIGILWEKYGDPFPENRKNFEKLIAFTLKRVGCHLMGFAQGKRIGKIFLKRAVVLDLSDIRAWKFFLKSLAPSFLHGRLFEFENESIEAMDIDLEFSRKYLIWPLLIPEKRVKK